MSNLDKTGKKLIDSIRKTKKGPATAAVKSVTKKTTTKASPKASIKPKSSTASRKKQPRNKKTPFADIPFQDGSQVWPD
ncbi:MAG: hypothetical protein ACN4GR_12295 [Arenicellales bacterium]